MCYIDKSCLIQKNGIYIEKLADGMRQYQVHILEGTEEILQKFLWSLFQKNGEENSFADFYYKRVNKENKQLLNQYLSKEQQKLLEQLIQDGYKEAAEEEFLITNLDAKRLDLLIHISYQELLFSTFYFTHIPCTIWSNYQGRFLLFVKEASVAQQVLQLAKEIGITIDHD